MNCMKNDVKLPKEGINGKDKDGKRRNGEIQRGKMAVSVVREFVIIIMISRRICRNQHLAS